jgi:hypothetical protein
MVLTVAYVWLVFSHLKHVTPAALTKSKGDLTPNFGRCNRFMPERVTVELCFGFGQT